MTKLEDIFPKDSLYLGILYPTAFCSILFSLSWYQILVVVAIDAMMYFMLHKIEVSVFYRIFPTIAKFKNFEQAVKDCGASFSSQNQFFNELSQYPELRSIYVFLVSLTFKVLPVGVYIAWTSEVTSSFWENLLLFYVVDSFILIYLSCLLFIALHHETSERMLQLKSHETWITNYRDLHLTKTKDKFSVIQNAVIVTLLISLMGMVIYLHKVESVYSNHFLLIIFAIAIMCICKIQFLFQDFLNTSFQRIFELFSRDISKNKIDSLPLQTSPMLANFEYTFNQLSMKLEEREKEISQWLKHESEQFHLRTLGEVTAMVAHDMKTPLNVMSMSLDMLNDESISADKKIKYQEMLEKNLDLSLSFSQTLMAYVRGNKGELHCVFGDVHTHLLEIFKTQFFSSDLDRIRFTVSKELATLNLKVSRLDAMHVFYNLYQNAIKSTLAQVPHSMSIHLSADIQDDTGFVDIFLHDSGLGLAPNDFYRLIRFERFGSDSQFYHGLGLRLTNSILGHLGGKFDIVPVETGTCLKVTLPMMETVQPVLGEHVFAERESLH